MGEFLSPSEGVAFSGAYLAVLRHHRTQAVIVAITHPASAP
jgi:hypothetical protein